MIEWCSLGEVDEKLTKSAVTIGKFDGIHLGHQALLADLIDVAENESLAPVVVTFSNHPDSLLAPDRLRLPLIGPQQKAHLLEQAGVEAVLNVEFTPEFAALSAEEFVKNYLVDALGAKWVLVGSGFRFGASGSGSVETLRELGLKYGFRVKVVSPIEIENEIVSSTRIRDLLDQGDVKSAAKLLGRVHTTTGVIEHGLKIGRQIGFPTANMSREAEGYLPLDAVYAGWLYAKGERFPAALSVGVNETFQAVPRLVEAHVIGRTDLDLYDQEVTLEYVDFVRHAAKFDGVESLVAAIESDISKIKSILEV